MGQKAQETGKVAKRVRNMFKNHPKCIAVRHGKVVYELQNPEDPDGPWGTEAFKSMNEAKKYSSDIQCQVAGMKPDDNGIYSDKHYGHGNGSVRVLT